MERRDLMFGVIILCTMLMGDAAPTIKLEINLNTASIIRLQAQADEMVEFVKYLKQNEPMMDVWKVRVDGTIDVLIDNATMEDLLSHVERKQGIRLISVTDYNTLPVEVVAPDETENEEHSNIKRSTEIPGIGHDKYHTAEQIFRWLHKVNDSCGELCYLQSTGKTDNGNLDLFLLKIGTPKCNAQKIWIDCGSHAREWISPAVCLYLIDKFIRDYETDPEITSLVQNYDWYILTLANPDGYVYSHDTNRMWRKNRTPDSLGWCYGVDLNRNWDVNFKGRGSSGHSCSLTYRGKAPFSEAETRIVKDYIWSKNAGNWHTHFTLHSYGQMIMYPYSYTGDSAPDLLKLHSAGNALKNGIFYSSNTAYQLGQASHLLYPAAGTSSDYAYQNGIKFSYTIEMRDKSSFVLSADQIIPTGAEILSGLKSYISYLERRKWIEKSGTECPDRVHNSQVDESFASIPISASLKIARETGAQSTTPTTHAATTTQPTTTTTQPTTTKLKKPATSVATQTISSIRTSPVKKLKSVTNHRFDLRQILHRIRYRKVRYG